MNEFSAHSRKNWLQNALCLTTYLIYLEDLRRKISRKLTRLSEKESLEKYRRRTVRMIIQERDLKLFGQLIRFGALSTRQIRELDFKDVAHTTLMRRLRALEKGHHIRRGVTLSFMTNIRVAIDSDATSIADIYKPYVLNTAISFESEPPSEDEMGERIKQSSKDFPWLVWEQDDLILGYAYAGPFKSRCAYSWSVESTVYVRQNWSAVA